MISKVDKSNLEEAISLVTRINQDLAHKISYFGETRAEITADFCAVQPPEGYGVIATKDNGEIVGFFGIEMDLGLGRSWLFGPLVEEGDWDVLADSLYQALSADLPPEIADQELYFPSQNLRLQGFALRHGFEFHAEGTVLVLDVKQRRLRDAAGVIEFDEKYRAQLDALHDELFPKTYYSAEQLIQLAGDEDKYLLIKLEDENLAGYIFIQLRPASHDAYIDFLGVEELHRRQGIAQDLVSTAVGRAVQSPYVESITLTVNGDNEAAVSLYHSLGFITQSVSRGYRKSLSGVNSG